MATKCDPTQLVQSERRSSTLSFRLLAATSEQQETQHRVDTALDCGYLTQQMLNELVDELERTGRMLQSMIDKSGKFRGSSASCVREVTSEHLVDHR